jgi:benzoate/toluate 1,2-dioxygenase reductase subunit
MGHNIALNFEDGFTRFVEGRPGETVADASYRVGINIPLDCRDGACGTCKCRVQSGEYDNGELHRGRADRGGGGRRPRARLPDAAEDRRRRRHLCLFGGLQDQGQTFQARLGAVDRLSETTVAFSLEGAGALSFLPGQYVNVLVPGTDQRRSYSFSSPPGSETQSFLVRDVPRGLMSGFLREAQPGIPMEFVGPSGSFYLREIRRPLLFLAGGTGLAPFLSMLGKIAEAGGAAADPPGLRRHQATRPRGRRQVEELAARLPTSPSPPAWRPRQRPPAQGLRHGPRRAPTHLNGGEVDVYLCGPAADGGRGARLARRTGRGAGQLLLREVLASGAVTAIGETTASAA